ncbi:hypothetical protein DL93DRAFT_2082170 [Clavulina sp. PMI_390]|nr:hypothetical protein DL93DRAFT_2082170 [Clavulina sp. PMI_390]
MVEWLNRKPLPDELRDALTMLAGQQFYEEFWTYTLLWLVHKSDITVSRWCERSYVSNFPFLSLRNPDNEIIMVVTWEAPPGPEFPAKEFLRPFSSVALKQDSVVRVHAASTRIEKCPFILTSGLGSRERKFASFMPRGTTSQHTTFKSPATTGGPPQSWKFDVLEVEGLNQLVQIIELAVLDIQHQPVELELEQYPTAEVVELARGIQWQAGSIPRGASRTLKPASGPPNKVSIQKQKGIGIWSLPAEIKLMIIECLPPSEIRGLATADRVWADLTSAKLWHTYRLKDSINTRKSNTTTTLQRRLNAILSHPARLRALRTLIIGPCTWCWTPDLLHQVVLVIKQAPGLQDLRLEAESGMLRFAPVLVSPILLSLIDISSEFHLISFQCNFSLTGESVLKRFLESQPSIKSLYITTNPVNYPERYNATYFDPLTFLPNLEALGACDTYTFTWLVPKRPVGTILLHLETLPPSKDMETFVNTVSVAPVTTLSLFGSPKILPLQLQALPKEASLLKALARVKHLSITGDVHLDAETRSLLWTASSQLETLHITAKIYEEMESIFKKVAKPSLLQKIMVHSYQEIVMARVASKSDDSPKQTSRGWVGFDRQKTTYEKECPWDAYRLNYFTHISYD